MRILAFLSTISLLWRKLTVEQVTSLQLSGARASALEYKDPSVWKVGGRNKKGSQLENLLSKKDKLISRAREQQKTNSMVILKERWAEGVPSERR